MKNGRKALTEIDASLWTDLEKVGVIMPIGGLVLPWWEMRDALLRKVRQTANIELLVGQVLTNIHDHGDTIDSSNGNGGIDAHFESGMTLSADFLVAADGVHSVVRELLGLAPAIDTGARVFRGSLTVTETSSDKLKVLLQGGIVPMGNLELEGVYFIVFNFHSKHPGRMTWAFSTPMTLLRQEVTNETELELLQEIFDSSDSRHLKPFPPTKVVDFSDEALSIHGGGWGGRSRVTLTGDAAHACRPTDGQGGNQAFEDAVVLCRTLNKGDLFYQKRYAIMKQYDYPGSNEFMTTNAYVTNNACRGSLSGRSRRPCVSG